MSSHLPPATRRQFLGNLSALSLGAFTYPQMAAAIPVTEAPPRRTFDASRLSSLQGEDFWDEVRLNYEPEAGFTNLENGYFSPMAISTREFHEQEIRRVNRLSSYYLRTRENDELAATKRSLAAFAGCAPEELVITRNTTEALNTVISGLDWARGDEVVCSNQDYPSMQQQLQQAAQRWGVALRPVALPLHPESDAEIVQLYERAIGPRTRLLLLTHLINFTGQLLPARAIIAMAHRHGVQVLVDASHAFAHVELNFRDLDCDYLGTSLHKWLGAPLGLGLLCVRRDRIPGIWPLYGDQAYAHDDIRKLEHIGTKPSHAILAIPAALEFHQAIGSARKLARLRFLKDYWVERARTLPGIEILSAPGAERGGAIACVARQGRTPDQLAQFLWDRHRLFTVAINHDIVRGVRITPHLYTRLPDLDRLVAALAES